MEATLDAPQIWQNDRIIMMSGWDGYDHDIYQLNTEYLLLVIGSKYIFGTLWRHSNEWLRARSIQNGVELPLVSCHWSIVQFKNILKMIAYLEKYKREKNMNILFSHSCKPTKWRNYLRKK